MTVGAKSILVLLATLVLGMVIGALSFSAYQRYRFRDALRLVRPARFVDGIERALEPMDDAKREAVRSELHKFHQRMREQREAERRGRRSHLDSIEAVLSPHLDAGQKERLREYLSAHKRIGRPGRRGPPRRGPPPKH